MLGKQKNILNFVKNNKVNDSILIEINDIVHYHKYTNIDKGFNLVDTLLSINSINKDQNLTIEIYKILANLYNSLNSYGQAAQYLFKAVNLAKNTPDKVANGWTLIELGNIHYKIMQTEKSRELYHDAFNYFKKFLRSNSSKSDLNNVNLGLAVALENISLSFLEEKNIDSALFYVLKSKPYRLNTDSKLSEQYYNLTLAKVYMNDMQGDSALKYYSLSYEIGKRNIRIEDKPQQQNFQIQALFGLVRAYYILKDIASYEKHQKNLDSIIETSTNFSFSIMSLLSQSKFFLDLKDFKNSEHSAKKALEMAQKFNYEGLNLPIYDNLYKVYLLGNDESNSYLYLKKSYHLLDSLSTNYRLRGVELEEISENMESKIAEINFLSNEMELNNEKLKNQKYLTFVLIISLVFFAMLIIGLFSRYRFKNKTMKLIENKNEELNIANFELNKSNETKNTLFAIIAHDLKNSIGSVRNAIDLLNSEYHTLTDEEKIEFLDLSKKTSDNLYYLLENLLLWSSAQKQSLKVNKIETNLKFIANQSIQLYQSKANDKNINLINQLSDELILRIDPNQIDTVIRNILNNAVKFTKSKGEIKIYNIHRDNEELIVIEDNGIGMPKDKADNLFLGASNKSTYGTDGEKGTGLGLLICKEFINMHDGKIWAESEEGKGTKIFFTLPR